MVLLQQGDTPSLEEQIAAERAEGGYAVVSHHVTADPQLTDEGFRLLLALESWAWNEPDCTPSNKNIAIRAGWFSANGHPNAEKVKRVLRELEGETGKRPYIRRVVTARPSPTSKKGGLIYDRSRIELLRPLGHPIEPTRLPGTLGSGATTPSVRHDHKEEALKKEQRLHLGAASEDLSDDAESQDFDEMIRLARSLPGLPFKRARRVVNEFALSALTVTWDDDSNLGCFRDMGWGIYRGEWTPLEVEIAVNELRSKCEQGDPPDNRAAWLVARLKPLRRLDADESIVN